MRVKSVEYENGKLRHEGRYIIQFEHNGVTWFKFLNEQKFEVYLGGNGLKTLLNSIIKDTIERT